MDLKKQQKRFPFYRRVYILLFVFWLFLNVIFISDLSFSHTLIYIISNAVLILTGFFLFYVQKRLYEKEKREKEELIKQIQEDLHEHVEILELIHHTLDKFHDSQPAKEFLSHFHDEFHSVKSSIIDSRNIDDPLSFLKVYVHNVRICNRILYGYISMTNNLLHRFTPDSFFKTIVAMDLNFHFFRHYISSFFELLNVLYNRLYILVEDFMVNSETTKKDLEIINESTKQLKEQIQLQKYTILENINQFRVFVEKNTNFVENIIKEYERNEVLVKNIQDIAEKMKMLSLNLSIEANRSSGNKVFDVLAEELQSFTDKIQSFSQKIRSEMNEVRAKMNNEIQNHTEELQHLTSQIRYLEISHESIHDSFTNYVIVHDELIQKTSDFLIHSQSAIKNFLSHYQELKVIEESIKNMIDIFNTQKQKFEEIVFQLQHYLYKEKAKSDEVYSEICEEYIRRVKTDKEVNVLLEMCDRLQLHDLKKKIESRFETRRTIIF